MGRSSEILFLLIFIATLGLISVQGRGEGNSNDDVDYVDGGATDCLFEKQYVKISSNNTLNITGNIESHFAELDTKLMELVTKEDLVNSTADLVSATTVLLLDLPRTSDVDDLKTGLIDRLKDLTDNVIDKHSEQLKLYTSSITDDLIAIKNQTLNIFNSLNEQIPTLASKSATDEIIVEINVIRSILDKMSNKTDTNRLENQLLSLKTEHDDIKSLCKNTDSSTLPSSEDSTQSTSEILKHLKELQELIKTKKCDNLTNVTGQQFKQSSKQTIEKSDIFGIISVVGLVVLFVLVIFLVKRITAIQNKLSSMQIQVAHERYYRRESDATPKSLQHTKPQAEQRNGSVVATNPVINMYEDSELTESLMDKN